MGSLPDAATTDYLNAVLNRTGMPGSARVRDVSIASDRTTILSRILRLRLAYDGPAPDAPQTIILKTAIPVRRERAVLIARQEITFYASVAAAMPERLVPLCYDAHFDDASGGWHLLLEDLTDTHATPTAWPLPPNRAQCETIIATLARLHAAWWDDPRLGVSIGSWMDDATITQRFTQLGGHFARFADRLGEDLPPERRDLFERMIAAGPTLYQRYRTRRDVTIQHGDAHVWNCFLPRDGGPGARLFDWDAWRINLATNDLAYMMALHWYPDRRHRMEQAMLDHYHATLLANGVTGYDRRRLDDDYRLSVLLQLAIPVLQAAFDIPPVVWWSHLQRILLAVDDLGCRELLG